MLLAPHPWEEVQRVPSADEIGLRPEERLFVFVTAPFGPFARRVAAQLRAYGARCRRIILNGGDLLDWGLTDGDIYRGRPEDWRGWIAAYFQTTGATDLILHGAASPLAALAAQEAKALGLKVHVFEEGYFRPHWITLEQDGVNAASSLPRDPQAYFELAEQSRPPGPVQKAGRVTAAGVKRLIAYYLTNFVTSPLFPRFKTAYRYVPSRQAASHIVHYAKSLLESGRRASALDAFLAMEGPLFLALLQRPGDAQLTSTPKVGEVADFIAHVMASFAAKAPTHARLIFKAHPLDHGIEGHERVVRRLAAELGLAGRVLYLDGGRLPALARAAKGVISVNSTGGLSAIELGRPTLVLGRAIYDLPGLTHQGGLDLFWIEPQGPRMSVLEAFRTVVMDKTQINGDFSTPAGMALAAPEAARRMLER